MLGSTHHTRIPVQTTALFRPRRERRPDLILRPGDCDDRLTTSNIEPARAMLQLYPAENMCAEAAQNDRSSR
ncbi:hypothetical protein CVS37_23545 [Burkholderia lata]|nr:hypothetical protein CVS37_23545 [Burkholderia lata]